MSDNLDDSYYQFSEEKRDNLLATFNIKEENIVKEDTENSSVVSEEILQLCIYIRNYDSDGNLLTTPNGAVKTCIDTFERTVNKFSWTEKTLIESENSEEIKFEETKKEEYKVVDDHTFYIPEELEPIKDNYFVINQYYIFEEFIKTYFENSQKDLFIKNKELFLTFNMPSKYNFYYINDTFIEFLMSYGYKSIGLDLSEKKFIINNTKSYELNQLLINNATIELHDDLEINCNSFYMDSVNINNLSESKKTAFGIAFNSICELKYIVIENKMVSFFIKSEETDISKWVVSSFSLYNYTYKNENDLLKTDVVDTCFKISNVSNVEISSINIKTKEVNMPICNFYNINSLSLNSFNITAIDKVNKNLVVINDCKVCTLSSFYINQGIDEKIKNIFAIAISNGGPQTKYSFSNIFCNVVGILSVKSDYSDKLSLFNSKCTNNSSPFNFVGSNINKITFMKLSFSDLDSFNAEGGNICIFDSFLKNITEIHLKSHSKINMNNTTIRCKTLTFDLLDGSVVLMDNVNDIKSTNFNINGDEGSGKVNIKKSNIKSDYITYQGLDKITTNSCNYDVKEIILKSNSIFTFNANFINNRLKKVTILGKISNSLFIINNSNSVSREFDLSSSYGDMDIMYLDAISNDSIILNNSSTKVSIDSKLTESQDEYKISITDKENSIGSKILSNKEFIVPVIVAEGAFEEFKKIYSKEESESSENDSYVIYGNI